MNLIPTDSVPPSNPKDFFSKLGSAEYLLNLLPNAVYYCDVDGNILFYNNKAAELWGRRPNTGEVIEKFCGSYKIYKLDGSFLPNDECPMAEAILKRLPVMNGDIIIERPDHSWVYVRANIIAIRDDNGEIVGAMNTLVDVSAERKLTDAHKSTSDNFRFLADSIPQLVWMANTEGEADYYNQNWINYSGLSSKELKSADWSSIVHPEDFPSIRNNWKQSVELVQPLNVTGRLKKGSDQSYRWFLIRSVPMKNEKDEIIRWFGTCTDINDQKESEEQLKITEKALKEKNEKLVEANEELLRINNHLDTFIYTASHDLKAPVANIEGLFNLLVDNLDSSKGNKIKMEDTIDFIYSSINKFKSTVNNLTEIAKIHKSLSEVTDVENISLAQIADEVTSEIGVLIKANQAVIQTDFSMIPAINFSRTNIKSVFYNLISNGIKYKDLKRDPIIKITSHREGDEILLSFSDNGLGIKEKNKDKLFNLFKRFHTHVEGSGMGLYIVKKVIDNDNGRIEVESEEGVGSTFKIFLKA
ncbi:MAG TPA: PAS domain-containing sensor histidine kinase [Cytophagales bacterium]|nr:PAS domain-containing sensor histidine kinase [Cytophagales bacterium]